jgi:hypothetical protein
MAAISYVISLGQTLEQVTVGAAAPTSGSMELRMDQTATSITDASVAGGVRALKRGELFTLLKILQEKLSVDSTLNQ